MSLPAVRGASNARSWRFRERSKSSRQALGSSGADTPDGVVTAVRRLPPVEARYAPFPDSIDPRLQAALERRGITQLYSHQAEALAHVAAGRNIVVTTPTASGKTLCYNLPVLDAVLRDPASRALYLFPTKALAQDQMAELHELVRRARAKSVRDAIGVHTYDGDTPADARRTIRTRAHVVLSNPDMLHSGILPHHPRWAKLFENLRFIVIDELHAYRGVFGSHLCNVLRRLRRIARHYGSDPQIHLLVGDDRQSARARRAAGRAAVRARRAERRAARREVLRLRQSAGRQSRAGHPALVPHRNASRRRRVSPPQPAGDRLRAEPPLNRDSDDVSQGGLRGRPRHAGD